MVCGSDGVDYHNECLLKHAACVEDSDIKIDHAGSCNEDTKTSKNDEDQKDEKSEAFDTTGDDDGDDSNSQENQEILKDEEKSDETGKWLIQLVFMWYHSDI